MSRRFTVTTSKAQRVVSAEGATLPTISAAGFSARVNAYIVGQAGSCADGETDLWYPVAGRRPRAGGRPARALGQSRLEPAPPELFERRPPPERGGAHRARPHPQGPPALGPRLAHPLELAPGDGAARARQAWYPGARHAHLPRPHGAAQSAPDDRRGPGCREATPLLPSARATRGCAGPADRAATAPALPLHPHRAPGVLPTARRLPVGARRGRGRGRATAGVVLRPSANRTESALR